MNKLRKERNGKVKTRKRKKISLILKHISGVIAIVIGVFYISPFLFAISTSFKGPVEAISLPPSFIPRNPVGLENYKKVFTDIPFLRYLINSAIIVCIGTFFSVFSSALAGYVFAKFQYIKGITIVFLIILATMMVPFQMYIIPLYLMMNSLKLVNTLTALIIPWGVSAFGVFLMRQFMLTIPKDLMDAARIDGASELRTFFQIVLPLSRSAISALSVFMALFIWDELLWSLIVIDDINKRPVSLGLALFQQNYGPLDWPIIMAGTVIAALPILVVFLFAQKTFIQGITMSGLKE